VPRVDGIGGMASFRRKFEAGLANRGIEISYDAGQPSEAILIIAGTRNLGPLWKRRSGGARIVQRLDGINWIHRRRSTGLRHFVRAEYGNLLLSLIRARLATHVLYQSEFSRNWWNSWYGKTSAPNSVVHNGVDLNVYRPSQAVAEKSARCRLLVVEGNLGGGYDMGLENAVKLGETLAGKHGFPMELMVVGKITDEHRDKVQARAHVPIIWAGVLSPADVVKACQSARLLFSADLHPACPNSVIEALACGLPVVAFDTGALKELVSEQAGRVVPYGGDPWKIDPPDIIGLAQAAAEILRDRERFCAGARAEAEKHLGLDAMVDGYLKALLED
jgi:glycosyltransferase involved in cell wall biosynthesis